MTPQVIESHQLTASEYDKILFIFGELSKFQLYIILCVHFFYVRHGFHEDFIHPYFVELDAALGSGSSQCPR